MCQTCLLILLKQLKKAKIDKILQYSLYLRNLTLVYIYIYIENKNT